MSQPSAERFHALDATRAFALMLGVTFHIAWCFIPRGAGTPSTDVSANAFFDWLFCTSHAFRMQLFFLIAGFFGRLLYHRRGPKGFLIHRAKRILIPLILAWPILVPLSLITWIWGRGLSGQYLTPVDLNKLIEVMLDGIVIIPYSSGGLFGWFHLWFLYYLLLLYATFLVLRALYWRLVPRATQIAEGIDQYVIWCVLSPWAVFLLAAELTPFLWGMHLWIGIDTPNREILPVPLVLGGYGLFFTFGWLLHREPKMLRHIGRRWRSQYAIALLISIGLFGWFDARNKAGVAPGEIDRYPRLVQNQIADWPAFLDRLTLRAHDAAKEPNQRILWERLPFDDRKEILKLEPPLTTDEQIGVCQTIDRWLPYPELFLEEQDTIGEMKPLQRRVFLDGSVLANATVNRAELERLFEASLRGDPTTTPGYWSIKLVYSYLYAILSWLVVFATLGFFQEKCSHHSPVWRYIADSSYWIYLAHIPFVIYLHLLVFDRPWPTLLKFVLLNVVSFAVLFASYHLLVRSTPIGLLLNGRRYPFVVRKSPGDH